MMGTGGLALGASLARLSPCHAAAAARLVPADKKLDPQRVESLFAKGERRPYRGAELENIGMPCGGIGAGELYVRGDGTLAHWWIFNNARNYGNGPCTCYSSYRPPTLLDQGFLVRVKTDEESPQVRRLNSGDFDDIRFFGEYPIATIEYRTTKKPALPVAISLEVFSPFVPLNARDSANPATVLRFRIENTSRRAIDVDLAGWLQNGVCLELAGQCVGDSLNQVERGKKHVAVRMQLVESTTRTLPKQRVVLFDDFEDGTYDKWTVHGKAFGSSPMNRSSADPQRLAGYAGSFLAITTQGGNQPGKLVSKSFKIAEAYLCYYLSGKRGRTVKLYVGDRWLRTNSDKPSDQMRLEHWNVAEYVGQEAHLEITGNTSDPISLGRIYFTNVAPDAKAAFPKGDGEFGDMALAVLDPNATAVAAYESWESFQRDFAEDGRLTGVPTDRRPLGTPQCAAIASGVQLQPGQEKQVAFLVTWHFPNLRQGQVVMEGEVSCVGGSVGHRYDTWFDSAIAVTNYLAENLERLYRQTKLFRDTYFDTTLPYWFVQRIGMPVSTLASATCQWHKDGRFWAYEGVACCPGTTPHVWNYAQAVARLFPDLERSVREMQDLGPGFDAKSGLVHSSFDGQAGTVLKIYREHQMSTNNTFLQGNWLRTKQALEYLIKHDGNEDGIIEGQQPQTYDGSFVGANTYVGSLYLAALRAGEEMARVMGDRPFADRASGIFDKGRQNTLTRLWNGEYFIHDVDRNHLPPGNHYADGCLSDQIFGQAWAHQVGLGYLYPRANVLSALHSIWTYNWAPDVRGYNQAYEPWRWYAYPGEPGLLLCTWPKSEHLGNRAVGYCNEVWTGIEYQVATNMLYDGMVTEALAIVRGIHDRYNGARHNPWNEVECGDHYARALASWGCLLAASGYSYDGPAGRIGFAPRLTPQDFKYFFSAAEGWGSLTQKRRDDTQINRIEVKWGQLRVKSLIFELPDEVRLSTANVSAAGMTIPTDFRQTGSRVALTLARDATVKADEVLQAELTW